MGNVQTEVGIEARGIGVFRGLVAIDGPVIPEHVKPANTLLVAPAAVVCGDIIIVIIFILSFRSYIFSMSTMAMASSRSPIFRQ